MKNVPKQTKRLKQNQTQIKTKQNKTKQNKTKQNKTKQNKMVMNMFGNEEMRHRGSDEWQCVNCGNTDICETEMCPCWEEPTEVECDVCGNVWDGNAQCTCLMMGEASDYDLDSTDGEMSEGEDNDALSVSSDASEQLECFEETGHISMEMSRGSIKQMLAIARSQVNTCDEPEWMDDVCDTVVAGTFTQDGYFVPPKTEKTTKKVVDEYPMLTEPERAEFYEQLGKQPIEDIVDMLNMRRMREYESARVYHLHWPVWAEGEPPVMQFVKRVV